jgi:LEA14-like dessication related protein
MVKKKGVLNSLLFLSLTLMLAGCAGLFKPMAVPEIALAGIGIQKLDFFETVLQLKLRVTNPNPVPLAVKGLTCELELDDQPVATGHSQAAVQIPASGSDYVTVTVHTSAAKIAATLLEVLRQGSGNLSSQGLKYRLKGDLRMEGGLFLPSSIPFDTRGKLPVDHIFKQ